MEKMYGITTRKADRTDPDFTLFLLAKGLTMAKKINHRIYEAMYLRQMGMAYWEKKDPDMAITYIQHAMDIEKKLGLMDQEIFDLVRIARLHLDLGNIDKVLLFQKRAEEVYRKWYPN